MPFFLLFLPFPSLGRKPPASFLPRVGNCPLMELLQMIVKIWDIGISQNHNPLFSNKFLCGEGKA